MGEVRASIILNGKAIGIWEWDKKSKRINVKYFTNPSLKTKKKVEDIKQQFEFSLYPDQQITLFNNFESRQIL